MCLHDTYDKYHTSSTYNSNTVRDFDFRGSAARSRMVWSMAIGEQWILKRSIIIKYVNNAKCDGYNKLFITYLDKRV